MKEEENEDKENNEEKEKKDEKDVQECSTFRIITLGNCYVGKTSIINKYVNNIFKENYLTTIGMNMSTKEIFLKNKQKIKLLLVDTAGQEKYKALAKQYYRNADGVLFVFDLNNVESFEDITSWMKLFFEENKLNEKPIPTFFDWK